MKSQEPPNGDFVAYIEQLQRDSAARLRASGAAQLVELPNSPLGTRAAPPTGTTHSTPFPPTAPVQTKSRGTMMGNDGPVLDRQQADELAERLKNTARNAPREGRARAGPAIAVVVGGLMIAHALLANGGIVALIIGVGLAGWGVQRLRAAVTGSTADRLRRHAEYKQRVSQTFGKPPS